MEANALATADKLYNSGKTFTIGGVPSLLPIADYLTISLALFRMYKGWCSVSEVKANWSADDVRKVAPMAREWQAGSLHLEKTLMAKLGDKGKEFVSIILEA